MGFFKIDRQLFNHWLWEDRPFSKGQAWIDLIGLANYEDSKAPYQGKIVMCKRGTVYRSMSFLSKRWGWSRKKTKSFIALLESDGMVTTKVTTHRTAITIENYEKFQDASSSEGTTKVATRVTTKEQQRNSKGSNEKERIKKNKEGEEVYMAQPRNDTLFSPPSVHEVAAYCKEKGYDIDAEKFVAYYAARDWILSRGQQMKDWKASVRYWNSNRREKEKHERNEVKVEIDDSLDRELFGDEWV